MTMKAMDSQKVGSGLTVRVGCDADELLVTSQDAELLQQETTKTKKKK